MNSTKEDRTVRAMTNDGAFRVMTVRSTQTVQRVIDAQKATGYVAAVFGQLLTGAVLVRETMAPGLQVQCILANRTAGQLVADSLPGGITRGLVQLKGETFEVNRENTALLVTRALPNGELHKGIVETRENSSVSTWLTDYMMRSEQIMTRIGVGCIIRDGQVVEAGGYILQELPEAETQTLLAQTVYLDSLPHIDQFLLDHDADPHRMMDTVLKGHERTLLAEDTIRFDCNCSEVRVLSALATIGRDELESMVASGDTNEINCDYCGTTYAIGPEKLRTLLTSS